MKLTTIVLADHFGRPRRATSIAQIRTTDRLSITSNHVTSLRPDHATRIGPIDGSLWASRDGSDRAALDRQLAVSWSAPDGAGNSDIDSYTAKASIERPRSRRKRSYGFGFTLALPAARDDRPRTPATTTSDGRLVVVLLGHEIVFGLCVRLLRGEVIELADETGRRWRATMDSFSLMLRGAVLPLLENAHAYDVALLLHARTPVEGDPWTQASLPRRRRRRRRKRPR